MKVIALSFDVASDKHDIPRFDGYLGYAFCVGTVIFGPWTSYHDYISANHNNSTKGFVSFVDALSIIIRHLIIPILKDETLTVFT